jgi:hypothetical protein
VCSPTPAERAAFIHRGPPPLAAPEVYAVTAPAHLAAGAPPQQLAGGAATGSGGPPATLAQAAGAHAAQNQALAPAGSPRFVPPPGPEQIAAFRNQAWQDSAQHQPRAATPVARWLDSAAGQGQVAGRAPSPVEALRRQEQERQQARTGYSPYPQAPRGGAGVGAEHSWNPAGALSRGLVTVQVPGGQTQAPLMQPVGQDPWATGVATHPDWAIPGWGVMPPLDAQQGMQIYNGAVLTEVNPPLTAVQAGRLSQMGVAPHRQQGGPQPAPGAAPQQHLRALSPGSVGGAPSHYGDLGAGAGLSGWHGGGGGGWPAQAAAQGPGGHNVDDQSEYGIYDGSQHEGGPWEGIR